MDLTNPTSPMPLFWSPEYNATAQDFETTRKADAIVESLRRDPIPGIEILTPRSATYDECVAVHAPAFVEAVISGEPRALAGSAGIGWDPAFATSVLASTGGARDAALAALDRHAIAGSLSSGLHHARYERGSGYCTFNGLVIAARAALAQGAERIVILDFDAHCGGGTEELTRDLPGVEQHDVSVSPFDRYASRPGATLELVEGDAYLDAIGRALDAVANPGAVDLVIYNAGMDPHARAGGVSGIDDTILETREERVFAWAHTHGMPVAFVLAGGYTQGLDLDGVVTLHRITIRHAAAAAGRLATGP